MSKDSPRVLIIGAGIAGLTAARTLIQGGITDVQIYEARDRIGGRTNTIPHGGSFIDEGGQWVLGETGNPIFELANAHGLVETPVHGLFTQENTLYLTQDGEILDSTILEEIQTFWETTGDEALDRPLGTSGNSMKEFFDDKFNELFKISRHDSDINRTKKAVYQSLQRLESINSAANFNHVSLGSLRTEHLPGHECLVLKTGYRPVLDIIAQPIPRESIHLDSPIAKIYWLPDSQSNDSAVAVEFESGNMVAGDHIICTIPVGVFKETASHLFQPSLPAEQMKLLERIGFGTLNKIFLEWETPWWDTTASTDWWIFVWREDMALDIESLKDESYYKQNAGKEWFRQICGFCRVPSQPNSLVGFIGGDAAITFEGIPEDEVIDVCTALFRRFTGDSKIPRPTSLQRSKWASDPYSKGSYVYHKTHAQFEDCDSLASPLPSPQEPLLQFAGEGFISRFIGTTHGAYLSGQNAAQVILDANVTPDSNNNSEK